MKTRSASMIVLLAVLSTASLRPLSGAPASSNPAKAYQIGAVIRYGNIVIRPGDSATKVAAYLGYPDQKLSSDTWVYRHFQSQRYQAHAADCTTLLISFSKGRVVELQKVNESAVKTIEAQLSTPGNSRQVTAGM